MRFGALIVVTCTASSVSAQHSDVGAVVNAARIETWAADHAGGYLNPERVFKGEMALISGSVVGDEPGYFFLPNSEFAGELIGFDIRRALRAWDPNGPSGAPNTNFLTIPSSTITFGDVVQGQVTTTPADPPASVTGLQVLVPAAGLDFHFPMTLNDAAEGIYLVELEMRTTRTGVLDSEAYWLVLNYGLDEPEHERAVEYVREFVVPAPGSAVALVLWLGLAARRQRLRPGRINRAPADSFGPYLHT